MRSKIILTAALALTVAACNNSSSADDQYEANAARVADEIERHADNMEAMASAAVGSVDAIPRDMARPVCKAAMAQIFGHSPSIMEASGSDELVRVSYRRPDDGKRFTNDCKIDGDKIVWRSVNAFPNSGLGPWRTREGDDVIAAKVDGNRVYFTTTYSDGSVATESQPLIR